MIMGFHEYAYQYREYIIRTTLWSVNSDWTAPLQLSSITECGYYWYTAASQSITPCRAQSKVYAVCQGTCHHGNSFQSLAPNISVGLLA